MSNLYQVKVKQIWDFIRKEDTLFLLVCLYLFIEYVRPQNMYPSLSIIPFGKIVIILSLLVAIAKGKLFSVSNLVNKLIIIFLIIIILSSIFAFDSIHSFKMMPLFILWILVYFLIINAVNTEKRFLVFFLFLLLWSLKMSQFSFRGWASRDFGFSDWGTGGGSGWFLDSGEFGIQMCIFFPLASCFFCALKEYWPFWKRIIFLIFPISAVTGMISSSSRGALIGGITVMLFMLLKSKHKIKGVIVVSILMIFISLVVPTEQKMRFKTIGDDITSTNRIERWEKGIEMANKFPFLGVGYKNWEIADERLFNGDGAHCHNIFIECMSELGYSGLLIFILMIFYTFINNYQTRKIVRRDLKGNKFIAYMAHGLDGALVGYLSSGFFVTVLYYPYFWINLSMTVALNNISKNNTLEND